MLPFTSREYIVGPEWDRRVVTINPKKKIGIAMSGGIDSWVLYNLLPNNVKIFNVARQDNMDTIAHISKMIGRTDIIGYPTHTGESKIRDGLLGIVEKFDLDELYTGVNHMPPFMFFPEFDNEGCPPRPWRMNHPVIRTPFLHLYKYHIIDLANQNNIDLSNTRSCTVLPDDHCNECWQCKERLWGYEQLL